MKDGRLEASDLMIGDWVRSKKWAEKPFKLTSLNANLRYYYGITSNGVLVGPFLIEELEPIPLTKEILEKIGFKYHQSKYGNSYTLGAFFLIEPTVIAPAMMDEYKGAYLLHIGNDWIVIKYVHELQHALKLCGLYGIDKRIEL